MPIQQIKTIQGIKRLLNLSGSVPTGNPVGTLLTTYKKIQPRNYLYCDGRDTTGTEEELRTHYPALYLYLGSNVLPDYRECVMVGAEQNTTDTIATHDVYAQGEFKDDQMQNITLRMRTTAGGEGNSIAMTGASAIYDRTINDVSISGRFGTTTHGKQKAVYVYIKAVDGVDISDEDSFLTVVENYVDEKIESKMVVKKFSNVAVTNGAFAFAETDFPEGFTINNCTVSLIFYYVSSLSNAGCLAYSIQPASDSPRRFNIYIRSGTTAITANISFDAVFIKK